MVGKIGDDLRMDYTAQGHAVGLAQRMEQIAAPSVSCCCALAATFADKRTRRTDAEMRPVGRRSFMVILLFYRLRAPADRPPVLEA